MNTNSITVTQRMFKLKFNLNINTSPPTRRTILRWVANFRSIASVNKKRTGGKEPWVRTAEKIKLVKNLITETPNKSCRKLALDIEMSNSTVNRILKNDLKMHPYKIMIT